MAKPQRPHCLAPAACAAPGPRHCKRCASKMVWGDASNRARLAEAIREKRRSNPEWNARAREASRARWRDPEFVRRQRKALLRAMRDEGVRERHREGVKAAWRDPGHRERRRLAKQERQFRHGLSLYGWKEYRSARREGFEHVDALDIARDAERQAARAAVGDQP